MPQIDPNELIDTTGIGWQEGVLAALVLVMAVVGAAFARRLVARAANQWTKAGPEVARFLARMVGWFVILLGVVAALMIVGFQLGPMFLILTLIAVILFLSARSLLENFGAGIILQTENPFHVGDLVEVAGEIGTVADITGRTTVLDTNDGRRIRIPNAVVLGDSIVNYAERDTLRSETTVGVEYGTDLDQAQQVIVDSMRGIDGVAAHPSPEALVLGFNESSIDFSVRFWHAPALDTRQRVTDGVVRAIARRLEAEDIVIAFPQVVVWRGDSPGSA